MFCSYNFRSSEWSIKLYLTSHSQEQTESSKSELRTNILPPFLCILCFSTFQLDKVESTAYKNPFFIYNYVDKGGFAHWKWIFRFAINFILFLGSCTQRVPTRPYYLTSGVRPSVRLSISRLYLVNRNSDRQLYFLRCLLIA